MRNIPDLYSFAFASEGQIFDSLKKAKNIFQFKIAKRLVKFLQTHTEEVIGRYFDDLSTFDQREFIKKLIIDGEPIGAFIPHNKIDRHFLYINCVVPKGKKGQSLSLYLLTEVRYLSALFRLLLFGSDLFMETDEGQEYAMPLLIKQGLFPVFFVKNGYFHLDFELREGVLKGIRILLIAEGENAEKEVTTAINSILKLIDPELQHSTDVSLRDEYIQARIFGDGCALITDFSGSDDPEEVWHIVAKHVDCPLQLTALLAAIGTLLRCGTKW